jgi:hypothetical protein
MRDRRRAHRGARGAILHVALALLTVLGTLVASPRAASAYTWMIRHEYTGCTQCHADPSGSSLLTPYGRAQGEILLRTHYGQNTAEEDPGRAAQFLWGVVPLPEPLLLQADVRGLLLTRNLGKSSADTRYILMQADISGQVQVDRLRINGSIGFAPEGALPAAITHRPDNNLVSRTHWVGYVLDEDERFMVRAGRMNLPFGVRVLEHTMLARRVTRTDINAGQQHGAALSYNGPAFRGEIMAIAGNFQLNPDAFRERGYSGYLEVPVAERMAVGASSLITYAERDVLSGVGTTRHAHGGFARLAPVKPVVVLAEMNLLHAQANGAGQTGYVGMLQTDVEPLQGLHFIGTGEVLQAGAPNTPATWAGWLSSQWFFYSHVDARVDAIYQSIGTPVGRVDGVSLLLQMHGYL